MPTLRPVANGLLDNGRLYRIFIRFLPPVAGLDMRDGKIFGKKLYSARPFKGRDSAAEQEPRQARLSIGRRRHKVAAGLVTAGLVASGVLTGSGVFVEAAPVGAGFTIDAGDLRHILKQIQIAEAHSAGGDLFGPGPLRSTSVDFRSAFAPSTVP